MTKFSANLGFLWNDLPLPNAIRAAGAAGFEAVECHWPYEFDAGDVIAALKDTGLSMISLNTRLGVNGVDDLGVMSLPGRQDEARRYVDEAVAYASRIGCRNINAVAGKSGGGAAAEAVFRDNLVYACGKAAAEGITILIEPMNQRDAPRYHLRHARDGIETIKAVGAGNLKLMFDCYHAQITDGDLSTLLRETLPYIGHIQFAAVPDRGEPDSGEVNYPYLFKILDEMGWQGHAGAEYRPRTTIEEGLGWLNAYR